MEEPRKEVRAPHVISGATGELLVALKLVQHGFSVSWPLTDIDGYDLICDSGERITRVQVKTSTEPTSRGTWRVNLVRGHGKKRVITREDCDFVVIVLNYNDGPAIYILPVDDIQGMCPSFFPPGQHPRWPEKWKTCMYEEYRDRFDLMR